MPVYPPPPGRAVEGPWGSAVSEHVVQRFATAAERDAKWTTPPTGALCVTVSPLVGWMYTGTVWAQWGGAPGVGVLIGSISMWAAPAAPALYLLCDGAAVSRLTYPDLFTVIGVTWGQGDGVVTFNVPDLRGRAPIGAGQGTGLTNRPFVQPAGSEALRAHAHGVVLTTGTQTANHTHPFTT